MFVLIYFIYENDLVALGQKVCLKKRGGPALGRWHPFEKKLNACGREKKICLKKRTNSHLSDGIRLRKSKRTWA